MSEPAQAPAELARLERLERTIETLVSELEALPGGNALRRLGAKLRSALEPGAVTPSTTEPVDSQPEPPAEVQSAARSLGVQASELWAWVRSRV